MLTGDAPPCVPICKGPIPQAPLESGMDLTYVIPRTNQSQRINYTDYLANNKYRLFSGDRLVYECTEELTGVHGGTDWDHDSFQ